MLAISAADILSKRVGATEKFIQAMFSLATKLAPCVLFIDEADSLFRRRSSNDSEWVRSMINQFLLEMDGLGTKSDTPFVLIATNRPTDLDDAFLRRLPHKVFFPLPSEEDRVLILKTLVKEQDLHPLVSIEALAKATPGFSGSDLRSLCGHAALMFAIEQVKSHQTRLGDPLTALLLLENRHFAKALGNTHPSVSRWSVEKMEEFAARFNPQDFEPDDDSINLEQPLISDHWIHQLRDFVIEQS
jgi:SpoVK/Ycf46/Vps4 family AAA+-type ATPase